MPPKPSAPASSRASFLPPTCSTKSLKTADAIAGMPPLAAIANKEMVNAAFETPLDQGIRFERRLFHGLFGTEDQKEGMTAFVEKRPGNWKGAEHGEDRIHRARPHGRRNGAEPCQGRA